MPKIKKTIFSGVQPSGNLHLGNYLGAITQWADLQKAYNCIFCVVDYHAMTVKQDPVILRKKIVEIAKIYLAAGIDPKKTVIFQQSDIQEHTELAWVLNTVTRMSDLNKMTQFKDKAGIVDTSSFKRRLKDILKETEEKNIDIKSIERRVKRLITDLEGQKKKENAGVGLFDYPVLMAADILLYSTDAVPVGEDQTQHVELARILARRFNNDFGTTFHVPNLIVRKEGARIMGLDNPLKKMSKSADSAYNFIALTDDVDLATNKIMRAVTDSDNEIRYDMDNKPAISNLLTIYSLLTPKTIKELEVDYKGKGYGDFKNDLALVVKKFLNDFQRKFNSISDSDVKRVLSWGAKKAREKAAKTMRKVKKKIGINI